MTTLVRRMLTDVEFKDLTFSLSKAMVLTRVKNRNSIKTRGILSRALERHPECNSSGKHHPCLKPIFP